MEAGKEWRGDLDSALIALRSFALATRVHTIFGITLKMVFKNTTWPIVPTVCLPEEKALIKRTPLRGVVKNRDARTTFPGF